MAGSPGYVGKPRYLVYLDDAGIAKIVGVGDPLPVTSGIVASGAGVNKFGGNIALAGGATETVWDGSNIYTFPATADITHLRGTAGDTQITEIQGLDTNWDKVTQSKAVNGAALVALDTPLRRVFRKRVIDSTAPAGNVDTTNAAGAALYSRMLPGNNQTLMAIYTVPAGFTAHLSHYYASLNRASGGGATLGVKIRLWARDNANGYVRQIKHVRGLDSAANSGFDNPFDPYFPVTEKSDIFIEAENLSGAVVGDVTAGFDLRLVANA